MALDRDPDAALGTIATAGTALVVALVAAAAETPSRGLHLSAAWPFLLAGLLSPGAAQIFVTVAIRESGSSRVSMIFGTAPLVSVTIALVFLNEPASAPLIAGAVLVVAGGVLLARERERPGAPEQDRPRARVRRGDPVRDPGQPRAAPRRGTDRGAAGGRRRGRAARRNRADRRLGAAGDRPSLDPASCPPVCSSARRTSASSRRTTAAGSPWSRRSSRSSRSSGLRSLPCFLRDSELVGKQAGLRRGAHRRRRRPHRRLPLDRCQSPSQECDQAVTVAFRAVQQA